MLGVSGDVNAQSTAQGVRINLPYLNPVQMPSQDGWVLKFDDLKNSLSNY